MKVLIIAAGRGERLQQMGESKPLIPMQGTALIERVIATAIEAGADEFVVVTGHMHDKVERFLAHLSHRLQRPITCLYNDRWQDMGNGVSVLSARHLLAEPFLLMMCDHIFDPQLLTRLREFAPDPTEIGLAVDAAIDNPFVEIDDVTRVEVKGDRLMRIGKGIEPYNGFDTGAFMATPALFAAIEQSCRDGDSSLTGGVRRLAAAGKVAAVDVSGCFWVDVDDPIAYWRAENALMARLLVAPLQESDPD